MTHLLKYSTDLVSVSHSTAAQNDLYLNNQGNYDLCLSSSPLISIQIVTSPSFLPPVG